MVRSTVPAAPAAARKTPLLFIHGGSHTGACFERTPDGREGWAAIAAARGRTAYVYDWPGHGTRPQPTDYATMSMQTVAADVVNVLEEIGPAVLVVHSMGGVVGWRAAELDRRNIKAIVAIAPGPPANLQSAADASFLVPETGPTSVLHETALAMWANSERFPHAAIDAYLAGLVDESPRALNERGNLNGIGVHVDPQALSGLPILVITGDQDPRHPRKIDEEVATYFEAEFIWLADRGLSGHGHMMMIEHGHDTIAGIFLDWLDARGL
jgi:pimeloyl-ACP methyl ester carboxylesterase